MRQQFDQLFTQGNVRLVCRDVDACMQELFRLLLNRRDDRWLTMPSAHDADAARKVDELIAVGIDQRRAASGCNHCRCHHGNAARRHGRPAGKQILTDLHQHPSWIWVSRRLSATAIDLLNILAYDRRGVQDASLQVIGACEILNIPANPVESNRAVDADPEEQSLLGARVRQLRNVYGMSQRELARLAGVTNGAISMIEQERVSPSVASLKKILGVFGLSLSDFFADQFEPDSRVFYRADEMTKIADGPVILRQLGAGVSHRKLQVLHETYAPGGDTGADLLTHDGEEAGIIIRGRIEITVGGRREVLGPGDGYNFNSRTPHRFRNTGEAECELVSVCTPPTF